MPLLMIHSSVPVPKEKEEGLLQAASRALAAATGKPEKYVMVTLSECRAVFAAKTGPAVFADVRGIGGLSPEVNRKASQELCRLFREQLAVPADRVYITFTDVPAVNWGFDSRTFG